MEWTGGSRIRRVQGERAMNSASGYRLPATDTSAGRDHEPRRHGEHGNKNPCGLRVLRDSVVRDKRTWLSVSESLRRSLSVVAWLVISVGLAPKAFAQETSIEQLVATALERSPEI